MKSSVSKMFAFFVFSLLCAAAFPQAALARPVIKFHVQHVYLETPGEATLVGYIENSGDEGAHVKWTDIDLTLIADNGQQMWSDTGIRHEIDDYYIAPGESMEYTVYIQNPDIPEYHQKFRWRFNSSTHWEKAAG